MDRLASPTLVLIRRPGRAPPAPWISNPVSQDGAVMPSGASSAAAFAIRSSAPFRSRLTLMGMGPRRSAVRVTHGEIDVRMGRAFRAVIPAAAIVKAEPAAYPAGWVRTIDSTHRRRHSYC